MSIAKNYDYAKQGGLRKPTRGEQVLGREYVVLRLLLVQLCYVGRNALGGGTDKRQRQVDSIVLSIGGGLS